MKDREHRGEDTEGCSTPPCVQEYQASTVGPDGEAINLNDGEFHTFTVRWDVDAATVTFFIDGIDQKFAPPPGPGVARNWNRRSVPQFGRLNLATWFPRGWAGLPDFSECEAVVDYVKVTPI